MRADGGGVDEESAWFDESHYLAEAIGLLAVVALVALLSFPLLLAVLLS